MATTMQTCALVGRTGAKVLSFAFLYFPRNGGSVNRLTTAITKMRITARRNTLNVTASFVSACFMATRKRIGDVPRGDCNQRLSGWASCSLY